MTAKATGMKTANSVIGLGLIIVGTFFFIASLAVNCQGSLIIAGGCETWKASAILTLWLLGSVFFVVAITVLFFGRKRKTDSTTDPRMSDRSGYRGPISPAEA